MEKNIIIRQRMNQLWVKFLLLMAILFYGYKIINNGLVINTLIPFVIIILIFIFTMISYIEVIISKEFIKYKFSPIHWNYLIINKKDIECIKAISYKPIVHQGGWGIRKIKNGVAYTVSGNSALVIKLHNGRSVLLGVNLKEEIENIKKIGYEI